MRTLLFCLMLQQRGQFKISSVYLQENDTKVVSYELKMQNAKSEN